MVEVFDKTSGLPVSAVLEPLTAVTASLRLIKPNMIRSVEKMMHTFHQEHHRGERRRRDGEENESRLRGKGDSTGTLSDDVMAMINKVAKKCVKEKAVSSTQRIRHKVPRSKGITEMLWLSKFLLLNNLCGRTSGQLVPFVLFRGVHA